MLIVASVAVVAAIYVAVALAKARETVSHLLLAAARQQDAKGRDE